MPTIHCINLDRDKDRWEHAKAQAEQHWENRIERFPAIQAEFGCRKSHIALIEKAKTEKMPFILIAEDDFTLDEHSAERFLNAFSQLPDDWGVMKCFSLEPPWSSKEHKRHSENLAETKCRGGQMYVVNQRAYDLWLEPYPKHYMATKTYDSFLGNMLDDERWFIALPFVCWPNPNFDTTRSEDSGGKSNTHFDWGKDLENKLLNLKIPPEFAIAKKVREEMVKIIPRDTKIIEFGSGEGTKWLRRNWEVLSFEENADWAATNPPDEKSKVVFASIQQGWYDEHLVLLETSNFLGDDRFSLLIDGPTWRTGRQGCLPFIEEFLDRIDLIIIDDTHRGDETELALKLIEMTGKMAYEIEDADKRCAFLKW